ncbi:MAG: PH domain-containing protein [Candidatus Omnitrophica bacterium]|nr:PH domain-containing protein [Candidatus Omnitrophota bacterium]MDD5237784.1 PH domain-containing protein [Candidatus Omnitrophota bacterium]
MQIKLQEGEQILFEGRPEKKIFFMWIFTKVIPACVIVSFIILWATLFFGAMFAAATKCKEPPFHLLPPLFKFFIPLTFVAALFYYRALKETYHYYITNQRCVFEGGIIVRRLRSVPYHKITDVEINQNIIERFIGLYSLKIFTPGTGSVGVPGFEKAEIVFYGLKDAETAANIIQGILKQYKATGE